MDFSKPSSFLSTTSGPFLTQNKLPSEMLAKYRPVDDFEPLTNDFKQLSFGQPTMMAPQYNTFQQYRNPYYDSFSDPRTPYSSKFPRARDYMNDKSIIEAFPHLMGINDPLFDIDSISPNAEFYVIRSGNDDNIHKAIKYHIWTSTPVGKTILRQAWQNFEDNGMAPEIYLVFTVVNSNQFLGVAKMISNVDNNETFKYWWETCKWFGTIQIKWLFVKDIPHFYFEHITEGDYGDSVVNFRDSTPISAGSGKMILQIFREFPSRPNIFDSFEYMDRREDFIRTQRDLDPDFQRVFEEYCKVYKDDPENFQTPKKFNAKRSPNFSHRKQNKSNPHRERNTYYRKNNEAGEKMEEKENEKHRSMNTKGRFQQKDKRVKAIGSPEDYPELGEAVKLVKKERKVKKENADQSTVESEVKNND